MGTIRRNTVTAAVREQERGVYKRDYLPGTLREAVHRVAAAAREPSGRRVPPTLRQRSMNVALLRPLHRVRPRGGLKGELAPMIPGREVEVPILAGDRRTHKRWEMAAPQADRSNGPVQRPEIRIHLPPAASPRTIGSAVGAVMGALARSRSKNSGTWPHTLGATPLPLPDAAAVILSRCRRAMHAQCNTLR